MKTNLLKLKRVLSATLLVLLLNVAGMTNAFAQTQVATLQHGDDISVFYGQNSFVEAYDVAENGDIITLSSGTFTKQDNITKGITLRGASSVYDSVSGINSTIISGDIELDISNETQILNIEGICFTGFVLFNNLHNPTFTKCCFRSVNPRRSSSKMYDATFVNCYLAIDLQGAYNSTLVNCAVNGCWFNGSYGKNVIAYNSFLILRGDTELMTAYNCIISCREGDFCLKGSSVAYNSIGVKDNSNSPIFNSSSVNCVVFNTYSEVFKTFNGAFSYYEQFILKEEIASSFLGNDGTEVGINGGLIPYNPRPTYMYIKHCNVANKSTIDGKLSVDIEVITEE